MQCDIFVGSPLMAAAAPSNQSPWEQLASQLGLDRMHLSKENLKCEPSTFNLGPLISIIPPPSLALLPLSAT